MSRRILSKTSDLANFELNNQHAKTAARIDVYCDIYDFSDNEIYSILNSPNGINRVLRLKLTIPQFKELFSYYKEDFPDMADWFMESGGNIDSLYMLKRYIDRLRVAITDPDRLTRERLQYKQEEKKRIKEETAQQELSQRREKEPPTLKQLSPIERIEGPTPEELSQRREKEPPTLKQLSPIERIEGPTPEELSQLRAKERANQINKGNQSRTRRSGYIGRMFKGGKRNTQTRARKHSTRRLKKKVV